MSAAEVASAVDLFEEWHDRVDGESSTTYVAPLPASPPGPGEQYRFEVDLDRCTGCKACVTACHSLNGLDDDETWRAVGLLVGGGVAIDVLPLSAATAAVTAPVAVPAPAMRMSSPSPSPSPSLSSALTAPSVWQQHVTTACHHCVEPACLQGCPVDAYEKDPVTGIVAHLDDQCIGCRYCMLTCPYEVPSFNARLGVVRKCDMCSDRLAVGEEPACVQGCPTEAISIGTVAVADIHADMADAPGDRLVPTAPLSTHTGPTTVYLTKRPVPDNANAADDHRLVPASNHPPLVAMLVLTQLSVGGFLLSQLVQRTGGSGQGGAVPAFMAWATALVAIGASVLHLGRPLVAWRAVLGLRHSWLSREIFAFGLYFPLGGLTAAAALGILPAGAEGPLAFVTGAVGLVGVACSAQLYAVTKRPFWRLDRTAIRFVVTMATTGGAAVALAASVAATADSATAASAQRAGELMGPVVAIGVLVGVVATGVFLLRHRCVDSPLGRSTSLLLGPLRPRLVSAIGLALVAAAVAVILALVGPQSSGGSVGWFVVLLSVTGAAWVERGLFFVAAAPDRMPGGFH